MGTKAPQQLDFIFYFTATEIQRHWCLQTCHSLHLSSLPGIISPASAHKLCSFCSIRLHLFIVPAGWSGLLKTYIVVNILFIPACCLREEAARRNIKGWSRADRDCIFQPNITQNC